MFIILTVLYTIIVVAIIIFIIIIIYLTGDGKVLSQFFFLRNTSLAFELATTAVQGRPRVVWKQLLLSDKLVS